MGMSHFMRMREHTCDPIDGDVIKDMCLVTILGENSTDIRLVTTPYNIAYMFEDEEETCHSIGVVQIDPDERGDMIIYDNFYDDDSPIVTEYLFDSAELVGEPMPLSEVSTWKFLVEHGLDVDGPNDKALPITFAAFRGYLDVVKYLVEEGCDPTADNNDALGWAACNGNVEIIEYLIQNGCDANADNGDFLYWAAYYGHLDAVKCFINHGVDIEASRAIDGAFDGYRNEVVPNLDVYIYLTSIVPDANLRYKEDYLDDINLARELYGGK